LEDCRRINLFIGYPNVGKSNILEALGLFSLTYVIPPFESIKQLVRVENIQELFCNSIGQFCHIKTNLGEIKLISDYKSLTVEILDNLIKAKGNIEFNADLLAQKFDETIIETGFSDKIKRYVFRTTEINKTALNKISLNIPYGENILNVLSYNEDVKEVKQWMKQEFAKFGLEYVLDKSSNSIKIQRRLIDDEVFQLPYSSIADTLQRVIFYKTAIASNKNSVLLFEEPEAHAFPPYIRIITQDIIQSKNNQFFIATHSPIILNDFIEYDDIRKELAIYLIDYKNEQTIAKRLSEKEIDEVYNYGEDLFFNIEKFL
jgi:AAA15 family ATPase/GTPase